MQETESNALKKTWGDKPCRHPLFEKEYNLKVATGKIVCTICGHEIVKKQYPPAGIDKTKS